MENKSNRDVITDLINRFFNALKSGDFDDCSFTPDVTLLTPFMEAPVVGKDATIEALKDISPSVGEIKIRRLVIEDEFACAIIEYKNKDGITVDMCSTHRISNGLLAEIRPYFDPRPLMGDG